MIFDTLGHTNLPPLRIFFQASGFGKSKSLTSTSTGRAYRCHQSPESAEDILVLLALLRSDVELRGDGSWVGFLGLQRKRRSLPVRLQVRINYIELLDGTCRKRNYCKLA